MMIKALFLLRMSYADLHHQKKHVHHYFFAVNRFCAFFTCYARNVQTIHGQTAGIQGSHFLRRLIIVDRYWLQWRSGSGKLVILF